MTEGWKEIAVSKKKMDIPIQSKFVYLPDRTMIQTGGIIFDYGNHFNAFVRVWDQIFERNICNNREKM